MNLPEIKNLKTKNIPNLTIFLIWCLAIHILFLTGFKDFWKDFLSLFQELNAKDGVFITISPLLCLILNGVLSPNLKAILVFWRVKNPLPGTRAFTELGPKDYRIDIADLTRRIGNLPNEPEEQNRKWYKIYKIVQNHTTVKSAHQNFLLSRDLAAISFLFLIFSPSFIHFTKLEATNALGTYVAVLFLQYIILCLVAQNHGKGFVCNVLAEYCATKANKETSTSIKSEGEQK